MQVAMSGLHILEPADIHEYEREREDREVLWWEVFSDPPIDPVFDRFAEGVAQCYPEEMQPSVERSIRGVRHALAGGRVFPIDAPSVEYYLGLDRDDPVIRQMIADTGKRELHRDSQYALLEHFLEQAKAYPRHYWSLLADLTTTYGFLADGGRRALLMLNG